MTEDSDKEQFIKDFQRIISEDVDRYVIVIASKYAHAVEYGTLPVTIKRSNLPKVDDIGLNGKREKVTVARKNIRDWVAKKNNITGNDRVIQGDLAYKNIMDHGIRPHPFIRPAIHDAENMKSEEVLQLFKDSENFKQAYAEYIASRMKENLRRNDSVVFGALVDSIYVVKEDEIKPDLIEFNPNERDRR